MWRLSRRLRTSLPQLRHIFQVSSSSPAHLVLSRSPNRTHSWISRGRRLLRTDQGPRGVSLRRSVHQRRPGPLGEPSSRRRRDELFHPILHRGTFADGRPPAERPWFVGVVLFGRHDRWREKIERWIILLCDVSLFEMNFVFPYVCASKNFFSLY